MVVKFLHSTFLQSTINDGYFNNRLSTKDFNCGKSQNVKIFPASVKKIVEEHNGGVTLRNNEGPGAVASIRLPIDKEATLADAALQRDAV